MEFRKLRADEIDCRIARINKCCVDILLYKDARCDMNILDETVGTMNWKRSHVRDNANCIVSVWDGEKEQWVSKEDTGTESNTEKEKGLASDSFKRACFNWGIGRELYTAPRVQFKISECNVENQRCYDLFKVESISYKDNAISSLTVVNKNTGRRFHFPSADSDLEYDRAFDRKAALVEEFMSEIKRTGLKVEYFLKQGGVEKAEDLREVDMEAAINGMKAKPGKGK